MGTVVRGDKRGKTLGFPTVNLLPENEVIPPRGVYAVDVIYNDKSYCAMANVGLRPSFHQSNEHLVIEAHIFHFNKVLYGKNIIIQFRKKIRNEKLFRTKEALVEQLRRDAATVSAYLKC